MIWLVYERATGTVLTHIVADDCPEVLDHHATIETNTAPTDYRLLRIIDGEIVATMPDGYLDRRKRKIAAQIDQAREAHLAAGATTPLGIVQADLASRINISGAVNLALLDPANFSITWRLQDNESVVLNAQAVIEVGTAVGAFVNATYTRSFQLKDALDLITSADALEEFEISFA